MITHIKARLPRREWLLRCTDNDLDLTTCAICVNDGAIEIISADDTIIRLERSQIADFHEAFQSALALADAALSARPRPSGIPDM
jgi:hypothetical protein